MSQIAMMLLGEIPAIGPRLETREKAIQAGRNLIQAVDRFLEMNSNCQIIFKREANGQYALTIKNELSTLEILSGMDELMLKRFQKAFRKGLFILTFFVELGERLECLAVTEGLGAVLYTSGLK